MKTQITLAFAIACLGSAAMADSYPVTVLGGTEELVGYSFAASDLNSALPGLPFGSILYAWDVASQSFVSSTYLGSSWSPDLTLNPSDAFFIQPNSTSDLTFNVNGTPLSASTYTNSLTAGKQYFLASAYPLNLGGEGLNFLECMDDVPQLATPYSLNYFANVGDQLWYWDMEHGQYDGPEVRTNSNGHKAWTLEGTGVSPTINLQYPNNQPWKGGAFAFVPVQNTIWVQLNGGAKCP